MKGVIAFFCLFTACALQAQTIQLKIDLKEGYTCAVQTENNTDVTQSVMGQEVATKVLLQIANNYKVLGREDDQWIIEAAYQTVYSEMTAPTGKITFGSELTDDVSLAAKALMNKPFIMILNQRGKITEVKNLDKVFEEVDAALGAMSKNRKKRAMDQIKAGFGQETAKNLIEACFLKYPDRALKTGQVWMSRDTTVANGMNMLSDAQYRLDAADGQIIRLSVSGIVETDPENAPVIANGAEVKTSLSGSVNGKYEAEAESGWVTSIEMTQSVSGNVEASMGGQTMDIPMKTVSRVTVKRL